MRLVSMTDLNQTPIYQLREAFDRVLYPPRNPEILESSYKIFHPNPTDWKDFQTISIGLIPANTVIPTVFKETDVINELTLDPVKLFEYKRKLKLEVKFSLLIEHFKRQHQIIGYVKSPFLAPRTLENLDQNLQGSWNSNLSWLKNNNQTLPAFTKALNREFFTEFVGFVKYQKESIRRYRIDARLDDHRLHCDDLLEIRRNGTS